MATASVCGYGSSSETVCGYGSSSETVCGYGSSSETTATVQQQNLSYFPAAVDEERRCRACRSTALHVDWAQGDRICHNCGLVDSGQLMIDRPEWKDFNEAEDIVKGKESMARSGLVPVDETRYLGGLQPTTLSRNVFGGASAGKMSTSVRLRATNQRMDRLMEKMHKRALMSARVSNQIAKRSRSNGFDAEDGDTDCDYEADASGEVRPEYEQLLLQEEEDAHRMQEALHAEKWSLQRAIQLFGSAHEQTSNPGMDDVEEIRKNLNKTLERASQDLYNAYSMLSAAAQKLELPDRVTNEATAVLCKYAAHRDSLSVRGVSNSIKRKCNVKQSQAFAEREKQAHETLREHNKMKQMGSLCSALLFFTARNLGWPRSLVEVCESITPCQAVNNAKSCLDLGENVPFIKRKHCSKAMKELKELFPDFAKSVASAGKEQNSNAADTIGHGNVANFIEYKIRKLRLPPVSEACIRALVTFWRKDQGSATAKETNLSTLCSSLAYFVCSAGTIMQGLACQVVKSKKRPLVGSLLEISGTKKVKNEQCVSKDKIASNAETFGVISSPGTAAKDRASIEQIEKVMSESCVSVVKERASVEPFDVFSSAGTIEAATEQREYEMRRMWDAWSEQTPWFRSFADVEKSCGVSQTVVLEFYKNSLYPRRKTLLEVLKKAADNELSNTREEDHSSILSDVPMASVLLPHITVAAQLMKANGRV